MDTIASFTVDHDKLLRGIYVSRIDEVGGDYVTTFDVRMKEPNREPVVDIPALHTIEHIGATFLRNHKEWGDKLIYFGPMGCRTGCYVLFKGKLESKQIVGIMSELYDFISTFKEDIPGGKAVECGNALSHDLPMARWEAKKFLDEVLVDIKEENLAYPQ